MSAPVHQVRTPGDGDADALPAPWRDRLGTRTVEDRGGYGLSSTEWVLHYDRATKYCGTFHKHTADRAETCPYCGATGYGPE